MPSEFNVNEYWLARGRNYIGEAFPARYHRLQEQFLLDVLANGGLRLNRVLELGCGFGRITRLLAQRFPQARITALDLSPEQLANARRYCAGCENVAFEPYDFYSGQPLPGADFDAAIAIEVFLHHPEAVVRGLFAKLAGAARYIVNLDWSEPWPWPTPEHVWVHDFARLYAETGLACATFVLPEKVDGLQHRLFVAGRELPPGLIALEQRLEAGRQRREAVSPAESPQRPPPVAQWLQQLQGAIRDLLAAVPENATLILINDDQWGRAEQELAPRRVVPFLERDGRYWGPPADDATALTELERLCQAGATHLAVGWNASWWLDHYRDFHEHLRRRHECLAANGRVVIFKLR
jgi:SAM-dependent methyltransferase